MALTVFILASQADEKYVKEFWTSLAIMRRITRDVQFASPLYVEHLREEQALVPVTSRYTVILCMSNAFVSALLDDPALKEMVDGASRQMPLIISECQWRRYPGALASKQAFLSHSVVAAPNRDRYYLQVVEQLRLALQEEMEQV